MAMNNVLINIEDKISQNYRAWAIECWGLLEHDNAQCCEGSSQHNFPNKIILLFWVRIVHAYKSKQKDKKKKSYNYYFEFSL